MKDIRVLFVCTGNICRSPTAEGVLRKLLADAGMGEQVTVDSAGTHGWHQGEPPDDRAQRCAARRGYDLTAQRARQLRAADFGEFDLLIAMDRGHRDHLMSQRSATAKSEVRLMLDYAPTASSGAGTGADAEEDVPDPYYGGPADYEYALDLIESAANGLIAAIKRKLP